MTSRPAVLVLLMLYLAPASSPPATARDWAEHRRAGGQLAGGERAAFPVAGLLPKEEIGALRLRTEHGRVDGRGVVVAIFDTGLDPGAPGLQVTTDGRPKIIDLVDASGSGDVDTTVVRRADRGVLVGLTGRDLRLGRGGRWSCPTGEYRVGAKPAWESSHEVSCGG